MNYAEFLRQLIIASGIDDADVAPGSAVNDLMINPLSAIFEPYAREHDSLINNFSMIRPSGMTITEFDSVAANFLIPRISGIAAEGAVRMYYSTPTDVFLPANTRFSDVTEKLNFYTRNSFSITRGDMLVNNAEFPLYSTGDIQVVAQRPGTEYEVAEGAIVKVFGVDTTPAKIKNPKPFSGSAADRETNSQFKTRLDRQVHNGTLASPSGITITLLNLYPTITNINIIGYGDDEMTRDLSYSGFSLTDIEVQDYYGKVSGLSDYPYSPSVAFFGIFTSSNTPEISDFSDEFTNDMYRGIYHNDAMYAELTEYVLINETFTTSGYSDTWVKSDGLEGYDKAGRFVIMVDSGIQALRLGDNQFQDHVLVPSELIDQIYGNYAEPGF